LPATVIVGLQWGDEGKGKVIDSLAGNFDAVARFNGGSNAGHTVVVTGTTLAFHLLPSGVLQRKKLLIGNGVVVDPEVLLKELEEVAALNVPVDLMISDRAHLTLGPHKFRDRLEEGRRGSSAIGSTLRGISPTYADRAARTGIRVGDLADDDSLKLAFETFGAWNRALLTRVYGEDGETIAKDSFDRLKEVAGRIRPYIADVSKVANDILARRGKLLLEGAQGFYLDVDFGTYPYVTATHTLAQYAPAGIGVPSQSIEAVLGVAKAYCTRVGAGPFVTEISGQMAESLRKKGAEYGATTGRPRRIGWFDAVAAKYAARASGVTELVLTKVDVLGGLDRVLVCDGYLDGDRTLTEPPSSIVALRRCRPHYREFEGWPDLTAESWRKLGKEGAYALPAKLLTFVEAMRDVVDCPVGYVSYGPDRSDIVRLS